MKKLSFWAAVLMLLAFTACNYNPTDLEAPPEDLTPPAYSEEEADTERVFSDEDTALYPRGAYVAAASEEVYLEPDAGGEALTELVCGMEALILDASGEWYRISAPGIEGYIKADALRFEERPKAQKNELSGLVNLRTYAPDVKTRLLLTKEGPWGAPIYSQNVCALARPAAERLYAAQRELARSGRALKILDAYRDEQAQARLISRAVSPVEINRGSAHRAGAAVDVTLVDRDGREAAMPSQPYENANGGHADAGSNARILREAMQKHGFTANADAWWHFEIDVNLPLSDVLLADFLP